MTSQWWPKWEAPWSEEQVEALRRRQTGPDHPYTCPGTVHGGPVRLVPTPDGWACPDPHCDYRQTWAHAVPVAVGPAGTPYDTIPGHPLRGVPAEVLDAARRPLLVAVSNGDLPDADLVQPLADAVLARALPAIRRWLAAQVAP